MMCINIAAIRSNLHRQKTIEIAAVVASLLYTFLYLNQNTWCFLFGLLSPLLFFFLAWDKKIYADCGLQVFYFLVTIYGYLQLGETWEKLHIPLLTHLIYIISGIVIAFVSGYLLKKKTDARLPYLDSFITTFAIIATWQMMNFIHENWLYFIAVNMTSIVLFSMRKLYLGALMFVVYLLMSIDGYFELQIFGS